MGSVADQDRHKQARKAWWLWADLPKQRNARDWTEQEFRQREEAILKKLEELCEPEIDKAFEAAGVDRVAGKYEKLISMAVREAVKNVSGSNHQGKPVHEHIRNSVEGALEKCVKALDRWFYEAGAEELVSLLLSLPAARTTVLASSLNPGQRSDMKQLLFRLLGVRLVSLRMDAEPAEKRLWLLWLLYRQEITQPETKRQLGGIPRTVLAYRDPLPSGKSGQVSDPLGPVHANVWLQLGRELNKHGTSINDPESKSRIARSLGVSRRVVDRYLAEDIPLKITPDGKGGVRYEFDNAAVLRSLDAVRGKKRGRKSSS